MAQDEEKPKNNLFKGIRGFFQAVANSFTPEEKPEETESLYSQEDKTQELLASLEDLVTPSKNSIATPMTFLHDKTARTAYYDFITDKEADRLTSTEKEEVVRSFNNFKFHQEAKEKEIQNFLDSTSPRIWTALATASFKKELPLHIKDILHQSLLQKASPGDFPDDIQKNLQKVASKTRWVLKSEEAVISYIIKALSKKDSPEEKENLLNKISPHVLNKISHPGLKQNAQAVFKNLMNIYKTLEKRASFSETEKDDFDFDSLDFDSQLPEFGEKEKQFLSDLAQEDQAEEAAQRLDKEEEHQKSLYISTMAFDPRFDSYFDQMVQFLSNDDLGTLIGIITSQIRQIEKQQGIEASEDFIQDVLDRVKSRLGPNTIIESKLQNIQLYLKKAHQDYATNLSELRKRLANKNIQEQIEILREMSEDPSFKNIFGTVQNMERLLVEEHFDDIFADLPLKTQQIVAQALLADLNSLSNQYPYLIDRLKRKLELVSAVLQRQPDNELDVDYKVIDKIINFSKDNSINLPHEDLDQLSKSKKHRQEILKLLHEIDKLSSLDERIITVKFWLDNDVYAEKSHLEEFLKIHLSSLIESKAREGGLLRVIFDHLKDLDNKAEKLEYLNEKLKDPVFAHMHPIINNLIYNIKKETSLDPEELSEAWVRDQINNIPELNERINWIKIRQSLPSYVKLRGILEDILEEIQRSMESGFNEELEDTLISKASIESLKAKKEQGKEEKIHKNIITLTRKVMSISGKVERRKFIKEQEALFPVEEEKIFQKQRKLLYYLVNVENDEKPELKLKVLADKVLFDFRKKCEFFKILKLSQFTHQDKPLSMMKELNISGENLAYYAVYIVGSDKSSLDIRINFLKNFKKGDVSVEDILIPKGNSQTSADYKGFFEITPAIIDEVIKHLSKFQKTPKPALDEDEAQDADSNESASPDEAIDQDTSALDEPTESQVENGEPGDEEGISLDEGTENSEREDTPSEIMENREDGDEDSPSQNTDLEEDNLNEKNEEADGAEKNFEDERSINESSNDEEGAGSDRGEDHDHNIIQNADTEEVHESLNEIDEKTEKNEASESHDHSTENTDDLHHRENQPLEEPDRESADNIQKTQDEQADTRENQNKKYYEDNKMEIDQVVKSQLTNKGKEKSKALSEQVKTETKEASKKKENKGRIWAVLNNLKACYPEAIPDLIEQSIIPVFSESGDSVSQDIFSAINQNIFKPVLFEGADVNEDDSLDAIENFLGKKGMLTQSRPLIQELVAKMKAARSEEIDSEMSKKQREKANENIPEKEETLVSVLTALSRSASPEEALAKLVQKDIPRFNTDEKKELHDNLVRIKGILGANKRVNWQAVEKFFGPEATGLLKQIMALTPESSAGTSTGGSDLSAKSSPAKNNQKLSGLESYLTNMAFFEDPHKIIRTALNAQKELEPEYGAGKQKERQELIDQLYESRQIFTFDKRYYIGHGRLADFINDKANQGYDKTALAKALLSFLSPLETDQKAAFVGVAPDKWPEFEDLMQNWSSGQKISDGPKERRPGPRLKKAPGRGGAAKKPVKNKGLSLFSGSKSKKKAPPKRSAPARKTPAKKPPANKPKQKKAPALNSKSKEILNRASKIITDKLAFLIKQYSTRKDLKMLEQSYLKGKRENLIMLIDQVVHRSIYSILEKDEDLCKNLNFDRKKITSLFAKKLKKVK